MTLPRTVVGCMTGTSLDGLDAAIVDVRGAGLAMTARFVRGGSTPLGELGAKLRRAAAQEPIPAAELAGAADALGRLHARAITSLLAGARADLVCVHGQTVFHAPPISWQMIQPSTIARDAGCAVVFDLRAADLAAGGQGAPITPLADWVLFRGGSPRAIVNLGGFCNITLLPGGFGADRIGEIRGGDVCACNHVLDAIARRRLNAAYDADGASADAGRADAGAVSHLAEVLGAQRAAARSLGTGDELAGLFSLTDSLEPRDAARSACRAVARAIATAILRGEPRAAEVYLAGGGARNRALAREIAEAVGVPVADLGSLGMPVEFREAACMGVLGALCADGVPITLPAITGASARAVAGAWVRPPAEYPLL